MNKCDTNDISTPNIIFILKYFHITHITPRLDYSRLSMDL